MNRQHFFVGHRTELVAIAAYFGAGAAVTAIFSGSLAFLARNAGLTEVLAVGMIVPSFTWVVHLIASTLLIPTAARLEYWGDLGRICLLGSVALLPAAIVNICVTNSYGWLSVANVVVSVILMGIDLFRRSADKGRSLLWPASWCATIATNMAIFAFVSRGWW